MCKIRFALIGVVSCLPVAASHAAALTVCNKAGQPISVAEAFVTHGVASPILATVWGWFDVADGQCEQLNGSTFVLDNTAHYFLYARGANGVVWSGAGRSSGAVLDDRGYTWAPSMNFCEPDPKGPVFDDLQNACNRLAYFLEDDRSGGANYTFTFTR